MNISDFFRSFFGVNGSSSDHKKNPNWLPEDQEWFDADVHNESDLDDFFSHFHGDFHVQMQELQKQMEDMFRGFGTFEFAPDHNDSHVFTPHKSNPRDSMLKEPAEPVNHGPVTGRHQSDVIIIPSFAQPPAFVGGFFGPGFTHFPDQPRPALPRQEDSRGLSWNRGDNNTGIVDPSKRIGPFQPVTPSQSYGSSITVRTVRGADGKIEERRTVRDSSGKEETTVTRKLGEQSYTVITKKDGEGVKEKIENYTNMDEKELSDFDKKWFETNSSPNPCQCVGPDAVVKPKDFQDIPSPWSFFKKLIGMDK